MSFPLTPVPLSIGTSNGMLLKTDRGMRYLLENQLSPKKLDENLTLVIEDGNALFYALKDIHCNFKEIYLKLFGVVSSKTCDMIFSTDMYHPDSVKPMERRRRRSGDKLIIKGASTKKRKCWGEFLSNDENKRQLIKLMLNVRQTDVTASHLTIRGLIQIYEKEAFHVHSTDGKNTNSGKVTELKFSQEETDTRINLYCMYAKQKGSKNVRIRTPDSDIFFRGDIHMTSTLRGGIIQK